MRRLVLFIVMLAVLIMSTAGFAAAYETELFEAERHSLVAGGHDNESVHATGHNCHIGAHLIALHYGVELAPVPPADSCLILSLVDSPPAVFLDLPLRPPRIAA